jgi:hypothetical protein
MIISHPGECAQSTDNDGNVCDSADDENRVVIDRMVPEVVHNLQDEPPNSRKRTATVNAS